MLQMRIFATAAENAMIHMHLHGDTETPVVYDICRGTVRRTRVGRYTRSAYRGPRRRISALRSEKLGARERR